MPSVTVIVPMYNVEAYVEECIQSLKAQTFADFEAICVDDASSDDTLAVARAAIADDERFTVLEQKENRGLSAVRNLALERAGGTYVVNLDSDDYYVPETLQKLVARMETDQLDLLFFAASTFYETRELHRTHPENQDNRQDIEGVMSGAELFVQFEEKESFRPSACMFMVKRALLDREGLRFEEGIIHEDLLFTIRMMPSAQRTAFLNESLYKRRMRAGSLMTVQRSIRNVEGLFTSAQKLEMWFRSNLDVLPQDYQDAFCHRLFCIWEDLARDVYAVGEEQVIAFRDTLDTEDRIAFNLHVYEFGKTLDKVYRSIYGSKTFRVGRFFMAVPVWLKSRIKMPD